MALRLRQALLRRRQVPLRLVLRLHQRLHLQALLRPAVLTQPLEVLVRPVCLLAAVGLPVRLLAVLPVLLLVGAEAQVRQRVIHTATDHPHVMTMTTAL